MGVSNYGNGQMGVSLVSLIILKDPVDYLWYLYTAIKNLKKKEEGERV